MSGFSRLAELLPSVYRPEPGDDTLLARLLASAGQSFDAAGLDLQDVLRAHWADVADSAIWARHFQTLRRERKLPALNVRDAKDVREVLAYPHVRDLGRLASLLDLPAYREPQSLAETVEEYRQRLGDLVEAYRLGLTTAPALRRLVEAALPEDPEVPRWQQRWPFAIEEPVATRRERAAVSVPGAQEGALLAPLYRWTSAGRSGAPHVYLRGTSPQGEQVAATTDPGLELFTPGSVPAGVGLFYRGTVAPGTTLRLTPCRRTFVVSDDLLLASVPETLASAEADPAGNGPFTTVAAVPPGRVRAAVETLDHCVWLNVEDAGDWSLVRLGPSGATTVAGTPAGPFNALLPFGDMMLLAAEQGLFAVPIFAAAPAAVAVSGLTAPVRDLCAHPGGDVACAGDGGLHLLDGGLAVREQLLPGVPLAAVAARDGSLYVATVQALLLRNEGRWFRYEGAGLSEDLRDWEPFDPAAAASQTSPLPPVGRITIDGRGSLWLGTAAGLARYYARSGRTTLLEAYPDLVSSVVHAFTEDDRGMLWIAGEQGLFRADGERIAVYDFAASQWIWLGRLDSIYPDEVSEEERGHFRYDRAHGRWERFDPVRRGFSTASLAARAPASDASRAVVVADSVRAELGQLDHGTFSPAQPVAAEQLLVRVKPDETVIVNGGFPALPRAPDGDRRWRYLQLEPDGFIPPPARPFWSREGRLFLPPQHPAPFPGHFRQASDAFTSDGRFDEAVFSYPPSAELWMEEPAAPRIGTRVRLFKKSPDQVIDPALPGRVWSLLARTKAAGVPLELCVEGAIVKGDPQ